MTSKTTVALLAFIVLLGLVYFIQSRPDKGERRGERPRPMAKLVAGTIKRVTISAKGATVTLERDGPDKTSDQWRLVKPVIYPADKYAASSLAERLEKLEFGDLVTELRSKHAEYEVDEKSGVHVVVAEGQKNLADFYIGKVVDDFTMFRVAGRDQVYTAVGSLRFVFERELKSWRNRTIFDFKQEEARQLELSSAEGTISLSRPDEKTPWKVSRTTARADRLDDTLISTLLQTLASLVTFDFADGISLEKSGLDKPRATLAVKLKSGSSLVLLVGNHTGDDYWVQTKGNPQVFIIKKYTIDNLMKRPIDFRDKTVLSFKAEEVVGLGIEKTKDKEMVKLTRKGDDWLKEGKKITDASKVKTALEALSALKAEGFAKFTADELGLKNPDWKVEIQLKDRTKHLLTIGSVEKDSIYGLMRKGAPEIFTFRKHTLDRFLLDPKNLK